jgi:cytochrome c biogenesis protein CcmG/thiol:disulfide interchange protein DsbE
VQTDKRFWYGVMVVAAVLGGAWIWVSRVPTSQGGAASGALESAPHQGFLAPEIELATLDGEGMRLSDLRGKPVLINFWASWCGPCRAEMPHLQAAFEDHAADRLVVLGVNQMESAPPVAGLVEELDLTFPVLMDRDGDVSAAYQVRGLPTSFFVDADGIIRDLFIGPMSSGLIESKLETILSGAAAGGEG